jgi:hypothetical protein
MSGRAGFSVQKSTGENDLLLSCLGKRSDAHAKPGKEDVADRSQGHHAQHEVHERYLAHAYTNRAATTAKIHEQKDRYIG